MARPADPERTDEARRAATRNRLIGDRVTPETADTWIAEWEAHAAAEGLERGAAHWEAGWTWIIQTIARGGRPLYRVRTASRRVGHCLAR